MRIRHLLLAGLGSLVLALPAGAQDDSSAPPADRAPAPSDQTPAPAQGQPPAPAQAEPPAQAPGEPAADAAEGTESDTDVEDEQFIFSEDIPADQQVTFPVDI
jgi:hypothetical protein